MPNPAESLFIDDKVEVPLGKPIPSGVDDTVLLYNEYPFLSFNVLKFHRRLLSLKKVFFFKISNSLTFWYSLLRKMFIHQYFYFDNIIVLRYNFFIAMKRKLSLFT